MVIIILLKKRNKLFARSVHKTSLVFIYYIRHSSRIRVQSWTKI